jgi:hypothetical protein
MLNTTEHIFTSAELMDLETFMTEHITLCKKISVFQTLLTLNDNAEVAIHEEEEESTELDTVTEVVVHEEEERESVGEGELDTDEDGEVHEEEAYQPSNDSSSGNISDEFFEADEDEDAVDDDGNNAENDNLGGIPVSQRSTRSTTATVYQWRQPFFESPVTVHRDAFFYIVIFALHNDISSEWLVKVGITRATEKQFKDRYSIYYRFFFYLCIPLQHCDDNNSFAYYDAQQKEIISGNQDFQKYKMTVPEVMALQQTSNTLEQFKVHIGDSTGEVFYLRGGCSAHLEFLVATLTEVASVPSNAPRNIALPYKTSMRIKQLETQMFDLSKHTCLAQKLYRDGHFSKQQLGNSSFDFPLSITSVHNICMKMYEQIKRGVFTCAWSNGMWILRILWVGIGLGEECILLVLYFRQLGVFIKVIGLELDDEVVRRANASVHKYNLEEHISIIVMDVLQYSANEVKRNKIQLVYTSAVVDYIFTWKLYLLSVASSRVQAFIAPSGQLSNVHHIQGGEGTFSGPSLNFYPVRKSPKVVVNFCNKCEVATGAGHNSVEGSEIQHRPFKMLLFTDDVHQQQYVDEVCNQGRWHMMETVLKHMTGSSAQHFKDKMISTFTSGCQGSFTFAQVQSIRVPITSDEWKR